MDCTIDECSKNKGADQLRGYCFGVTAKLICALFAHMQKSGFLMMRLN